jgi:outer membrane protein
MRNLVAALTLALAPGLAAGQGDVDPFLRKPPPAVKESGLSLGVSAGYAIPMGSAESGTSFSSQIGGGIPLQVELGWRFSPLVYVGGYFQYAFASAGSAWDATCNAAGNSCSASDMRFGVDVRFTLARSGPLLPWVGVGAGYEIAKVSVTLGGQTVDALTTKGFEFGHLSLGLDYRATHWFRVGPFATLTFAQFSSFDTQVDTTTNPPTIGGSRSIDISNKAFHEWLQLGVKMSFDL